MDQHVKGTVIGGTQDTADHRESQPFADASSRAGSSDDEHSRERESEAGGSGKTKGLFEWFGKKGH